MARRQKLLPSGEGHAHRNAKEDIARFLRTRPPFLFVSHCADDRITTYRLAVHDLRPLVECSYPKVHANISAAEYSIEHGCYPEMIFDVGLVDAENRVVFALEIANQHWLDDTKQEKLTKAGIITIEITHRTGEWNPDRCRVAAVNVVLPPKAVRSIEFWQGSGWKAHQ